LGDVPQRTGKGKDKKGKDSQSMLQVQEETTCYGFLYEF